MLYSKYQKHIKFHGYSSMFTRDKETTDRQGIHKHFSKVLEKFIGNCIGKCLKLMKLL